MGTLPISIVPAAWLMCTAFVPALYGADDALVMSRGQYWLTGWAARPIFSLVADVDGDGRADLVAFDPRGDASLWVHRTSILGKPTPQVAARERFGREGLGAIAGRFTRGAGEDVLAVFADGSVRIASGAPRGGTAYARDDLAATIAPEVRPRPPIRLLAGEFDGDGMIDAVLVDDSGRLLLLRNDTAGASSPKFRCEDIEGALPPKVSQVAAGHFVAGGRAELVWKDGANMISRAGLNFAAGRRPRLDSATRLLTAEPADRLAVGRFHGGATCDVIIGRRLLPGGEASRAFEVATLPTPAEASGDRHWIVGDFDGNGRDDLLRQRESGPPFVGWVAPEPPWWSPHYSRWSDPFLAHDTLIHFSSLEGDQHKGYIASSGDGLLDDWKTGRVLPGGLDLKALGCRVGRKDLILEIERFPEVNLPVLRGEVETTIRAFAALPVKNPDGSRGIAIHVIFRDPTPRAQHDEVIKSFNDRYPPRNHRGIAHSLFCGATQDSGFGAAGMMGGNGGFHADRLFQGVLPHEFGHELGLNHDGYQAQNSPIYPSIMRYSDPYQNRRDGRVGMKLYSHGLLGHIFLNERKLSERLPLPLGEIDFLANVPYYYRLRPAGTSTLIDWNWNGVFGEEDVVADINYSHFTEIGPQRFDGGRADTAPVLVAHGTGSSAQLLLFFGRLDPQAQTGAASRPRTGELGTRTEGEPGAASMAWPRP